MTDLPTRLRTRADLHDTLTAGLMRAAADEIEGLRMTLTRIRDWPTVNDNGRPFTRDELMLLLAEMALEAAKALRPSPASSPIVKTEKASPPV